MYDDFSEYYEPPRDDQSLAPWESAQTLTMFDKQAFNATFRHLLAAYPNQQKNIDANLAQDVKSLWRSIFSKVPSELFQAAVMSFITHDEKGFFPAPGQIVYEVKRILRAQKEREDADGLTESERAASDNMRAFIERLKTEEKLKGRNKP